MKYCAKCGAVLPEGANFCGYCTHRVGDPVVREKKRGGWKTVAIVLLAVYGFAVTVAAGVVTDENAYYQELCDAQDEIEVLEDRIKELEGMVPTETEAPTEPEPEDEYLVCTVSELVDALEGNALNAKETYEGKYIEVTGRVETIDASGEYICLYPTDESWSVYYVQCFIKTDEHLEVVKGVKTGDTVTLRGEIIMVGEVLGYGLNIHSFVE